MVPRACQIWQRAMQICFCCSARKCPDSRPGHFSCSWFLEMLFACTGNIGVVRRAFGQARELLDEPVAAAKSLVEVEGAFLVGSGGCGTEHEVAAVAVLPATACPPC